MTYSSCGQLILLGGHFEKDAFSGGPYLLMQYFSTVFGSWPPVVFNTTCDTLPAVLSIHTIL